MKTFAACVIGTALMVPAAWQRPDNTDDFRSFYRAARLMSAHRSVYAQPVEPPDGNGGGGFLPYLRIPSYAAVLRPLAALPYASARRLWIGAGILALLGCVWLFPGPRDGLAVALAFSFPVAYTFVLGQDIAFVVLIALLAARVAASGREFLAGLAASLLGIKVSYLPAVGLVFLAKSRRGTCGLIAGLAVQLAASLAAGGSGWPSEYLAILRNPLLDPEPRRMLNIRAVTTSLSLPGGVFVVGAITLFLWLWMASKRLSLADALLLALPLGLIAAPHCYVYDAVVLIPLFVTVAGLDSWEGTLALIGLTPLPYLLLMTEHPSLLLAGSLTIVVTTIAATARFWRIRATPGLDGADGLAVCLTRSSSARLLSPSSE